MTVEAQPHPFRFEALTQRCLMTGTSKDGVVFAFYQRGDGRCAWKVGTEFWTVAGSSPNLIQGQAEVQDMIQQRAPQ